MQSCTTLPVAACFCCFCGSLNNTLQSYNIITTYASIIALKNVNRQRKIILR